MIFCKSEKTATKKLFEKVKAYQALHASEKFVVLFDAYLSFNLGCFDGNLLNEIAPLYLYAIALYVKIKNLI